MKRGEWIGLLLLVGTVAAASPPVGFVASSLARVDGVDVPSGATVVPPAVVEATAGPVAVHTTWRASLVIASGSKARLESTPSGLSVTAVSGRVWVRGRRGSVRLLEEGEQTEIAASGESAPGPEPSQAGLSELRESFLRALATATGRAGVGVRAEERLAAP